MKVVIYLLTVAIFLLTSACKHKDLCYDHSHTVKVNVVFDWKNVPNNYPESMRLYLYQEETNQLLPYEFANIYGGQISVPAGKYKALCFNSDSETVTYHDIYDYANFEITAVDEVITVGGFVAPQIQSKASERVVKPQDPLFFDYSESAETIGLQDGQTITMFPESGLCRYTIEIKNVKNIEYVIPNGIGGTLSGIAGGVKISSFTYSDEQTTIAFDMNTNMSDGPATITTRFFSFGCISHGSTRHEFVLYVIMSDGNKYYYTFDVTDQIHNATNPKDIKIYIDELPLPEPIEGEGGYSPSIDDWTNVEIDIDM